MPAPDGIRESYIELLALVYGAIPWGKIRTRHNAWDIWNHRIRHAATRPTLAAMLSRLCNHFGLQSLPVEAIPILEQLRPYEADLLIVTCQEHIPIAMQAALRARQRRQKSSEDSHE